MRCTDRRLQGTTSLQDASKIGGADRLSNTADESGLSAPCAPICRLICIGLKFRGTHEKKLMHLYHSQAALAMQPSMGKHSGLLPSHGPCIPSEDHGSSCRDIEDRPAHEK